LTPKIFKYILIRSLKQRKFAEYYIFLEEALSYYSEFQMLKLKQQHKAQLMDAKEKNVMRLVDQFKHDQLCIIKNEEPCEYKYGVIRGQFKHVVKMLRLFNVHEKNIILQLDINAGINLWNKCKEALPIQHEKLHKSTTTCNFNI